MSSDEVGIDLEGLILDQTGNVKPVRGEDVEFAVRSHHVARDITNEFVHACSELEIDQLVQDSTFTLWDSVQALEVMDPAMDTGFIPEGESLDTGFDTGQSLDGGQVLGVIDQIFALEMAWHRGVPLAQTLLTSVHIHHLLTQKRAPAEPPTFPRGFDGNQPSEFVQIVLRAYCIALIISCDMTLELVTSQLFFEEEDFNTNTYSLELLSKLSDTVCVEMLEHAQAWLQSQSTTPTIEALKIRISARQTSLALFLAGQRAHPWQIHLGLHSQIAETHGLATPVPRAFNVKIHRKLNITAPIRPSVEVPFPEACADAIQMLRGMEEVAKIHALPTALHPRPLQTFLWAFSSRDPPPGTLTRAFWQSSLFADASPAGVDHIHETLLKSIAELCLPLEEEKIGTLWDEFPPSDSRHRAAGMLDSFMDMTSSVFGDVLRSLTQNRCRIRRCLANVLADIAHAHRDFSTKYPPAPDTLEGSTALIDATTPPTELPDAQTLQMNVLPFVERLINDGIDTLHLTVTQWIIQLGFEQELYQHHELASMYRLLSSSFAASAKPIFHAASTETKALRASSTSLKHAYLTARLTQHHTLHAAATAFSLLHAALLRTSLYPAPSHTFTSPALQHGLRLAQLRPAPESATLPSVEALTAATLRPDIPVETLLEEASQHLASATRGIKALLRCELPEAVGRIRVPDARGGASSDPTSPAHAANAWWDRDTKALLRSCAMAGVVVGQVRRAVLDQKSGGAGEVDLTGVLQARVPLVQERAHAWWVVPRIEAAGGT